MCKPVQDAASVGFRTAALEVRVERNPLRLVIRDLAGNIISADAVGPPRRFQLGGFTVSKQMPGDEHYFGLGDKAGSFDRRDRPSRSGTPTSARRNRPTRSTKPFRSFSPSTARAVTAFSSTTPGAPGSTSASSRATRISFGSEGGPLDYYFIYGPTPKQVVEGYAYLTGTPPLPPLWALGFQQSRYSYTPESQVREIANRLRADTIPSDVLYLDIDYQYKNRPFTVDPKTFPNFPGLVADLRKQHFHLGHHHRPAHRARRQPGLLALRHRPSRQPLREESRRHRVRRHRLARPRSLSRLHPRPNSRVVGRPLSANS